ncbi:MAG: MFS transporter, partial [Thermoanaerobaculia bacterium]|nr:MFS transporter [Thermoanaerobaculia bacterium]
MPRNGLARKLGVLWTLYFVQGLPFGFQATALPIYLREAGVSLAGIGFASVLSLPWMLKIFWAPLVDRYGSRRFGHRRSWIVPLQIALAIACGLGSFAVQREGLSALLFLVFLMNLCAATMDIAVDGLAIDLLSPAELGHGNIAQVVGYKVGMLSGGGLLVWATASIGWEGLFLGMAGLTLAALAVSLSFREQYHQGDPETVRVFVHPSLHSVFDLLRRSMNSSHAIWLLLFIATYKLGETLADTLFKPFLVDAGFAAQQIGLWVGTWGMLCSILGSFAGGMAASRWPMLRVVGIAAALRTLPVAGEWWLATHLPTPDEVIAVTCIEHLFGGALTTALFAY